MDRADSQEINKLIATFYEIFDNRNSKQPEWEHFHNCCVPKCLIVRKLGENEDFYSSEDFLKPRIKLLSDGSLKEFHEYEVSGETSVIGNLAQHKSRYTKNGILNEQPYSGNGNKCFQLIKTHHGWRICSIIWEDDSN